MANALFGDYYPSRVLGTQSSVPSSLPIDPISGLPYVPGGNSTYMMGPNGFPVPTNAGGWTDTLRNSLQDAITAGYPTASLWQAAASRGAQGLNWEDTGFGAQYPGGAGISDLPGDEQIRILNALIDTPAKRGGLYGTPVVGDVIGGVQDVVGAVGDNPWLIPLLGVGLGAAGVGASGGGAFGLGGGAAAGVPASASVAPTQLTAATPVVTGSGVTTAGALSGGLGSVGIAPTALTGATPVVTGSGMSTAGQISGGANALANGSNPPTRVGTSILDYLNLGGGVLGGLLDYRAAGDAANAEAAGYQGAIDESRRQFDLTREDLRPYMESGVNALGRLDRAAGGDYSDFYNSPGYNFTRSEGIRDIGNSFAARGGALSGNALRALTQYNTGLASREYGNWWERQARQAGIGGAATNTAANVGQTTAGNVGNAMIGAGSSRASGVLGRNQGISNALGDSLDAWYYRRNSPVWRN